MRLFTTTLAALATATAALSWLSASACAETLIGVAAPLSGPSAVLGKQVEAGAGLAAEANGFTIKTADDACTADGGAAAARELAAAKVNLVVGFLCTEAIEAALPILKDANIPVITVGVRTESLTDRRANTGWPVFRLGPRGDDERNAVAAKLTQLWRDDLFAIVDDGTIYGREMAETFRAAAEQAALKPVFVDTFRPQLDNQIGLVGRLKKAGATKVFAGGDGDDIAISGFTSYDANEAALKAVLDEWTSSAPYGTRVANLRNGLGGVMLQSGVTVFDDEAVDRMTGGGGDDWFFASTAAGPTKDMIGDLAMNETVDPLT